MHRTERGAGSGAVEKAWPAAGGTTLALSLMVGMAGMATWGCGGAAAAQPAPVVAAAAPQEAAPQEAAPREAPPDVEDRWLSASPQRSPEGRGGLSRTLRGPLTAITIGEPAPPPEPTRPPRRGSVRVRFHQADMENAIRFLADVGRFNVVVESGLSGSVSASLDDVDPYDALLAIAEANGAEVHYQRRIVTVRRRAR